MMAQLQRKHVSRLVPADHRVLMPLLLAVTIVNFAVSFALLHPFELLLTVLTYCRL